MNPRRARSVVTLLRGDGGYATIVAAGAIAAIVAVTIMVVGFGSAVVARHRAQAAADLAALAAAIDHVAGAGDPCRSARSIVDEQHSGARLRRCVPVADDVVVEVVVSVELGAFGFREAVARARAGPVG